MLRHLLRRRTRRARTSIIATRPYHREKPPAWRRPLAWAALLTLIASAVYFSLAGRRAPPEPPGEVGQP